MITIVTYDITNPRCLNKMHKFLSNYGYNTQKSVFECDIDKNELNEIRRFASKTINIKKDSVRIYRICSTCIEKEIILGRGLHVINVDYQVF